MKMFAYICVWLCVRHERGETVVLGNKGDKEQGKNGDKCKTVRRQWATCEMLYLIAKNSKNDFPKVWTIKASPIETIKKEYSCFID